jgi:hypothetical protein
MMQLEAVKRRCFFDYNSVKSYLNKEPVSSLSPKSGSLLDQDVDPMSSSSIINSTQTIEYELKPKFAAKNRFF